MNIEKMIAKLDELVKQKRFVKEPCLLDENQVRECVERYLREILLAGKEPIPKELKIGGYQTLALRIEESNRRIGTLEAKAGSKVKWEELYKRSEEQATALHRIWKELGESFSDVERRIAELEAKHKQPDGMLVKYPDGDTHLYLNKKDNCSYGCKCDKHYHEKKDAPAVEPVNCKTICDHCGEYDYECKCKPEAKPECDHIWFNASRDGEPDAYCSKCGKYVSQTLKPSPSETEGQGLEDEIFMQLMINPFSMDLQHNQKACRDIANYLSIRLCSHSLPKDKILIDRNKSDRFVDLIDNIGGTWSKSGAMRELYEEIKSALDGR